MTITQQQIIALAVEAGLAEVTDTAESLPVDYMEALVKFAELACQRGVRDEREACAKLVESEACGGSAFNSAANYMAERIRARSAEPQQPSGWHRAVDEEMVLTNLGIADPSDSYETAKKKLNDLIAWHVAVATDPAVNGGYVLVRQDSATIPPSSTTE